ncbi:MAG: nitrile hydratase subunit alpha [Clostridia bacterium]|nr:nitrile hydratase subunit alpha [Clostridia bacterium]
MHDKIYEDILSKISQDEELKERFKKEPLVVLDELGYSLPPNIQIEVVEETADKVYFVIPYHRDEEDPVTVW